MKNETIQIYKAIIDSCINKGIKCFYAYDETNIFLSLEEAQKALDKAYPLAKRYTHKIWYFFFDNNLELCGFSVE